MVEPEEIEPLSSFDQVHDPGLGRLGFQPKLGQQIPQPPKAAWACSPVAHITSASSA
jgi:hypothetical protein